MASNDTEWTTTQTEWGDAAYEEVKQAFPGKLKSREVALCVWCYAWRPDITEDEIEAIARRDPAIMEQRRQKRISAQGKRRAKSLLGLDAPSAVLASDSGLTGPEREILLDLRATAALVDAYKKAEARFRKAEAAFEVARAKLHGVSAESARNLAEFDPRTRPILTAEGLLEGLPGIAAVTGAAQPVAQSPALQSPALQSAALQPPLDEVRVSEPPAWPVAPPPAPTAAEPVAQPPALHPPVDEVWVSEPPARPTAPPPAPERQPVAEPRSVPASAEPRIVEPEDTAVADFAVDLLKKKVRSGPSFSLMTDEGVQEPFDQGGEELADDFHANMDDCTKDSIVYWPEDRESLFD